MMRSLAINVFFLIFYIILLLMVMGNWNMTAMWMMAIGMLLESLLNVIQLLRQRRAAHQNH